MRSPLAILGLSVVALAIVLVLLNPGPRQEPPPAEPPPKQPDPPEVKKPLPVELKPLPPRSDGRARLAVLLVFDQMRADYLTRWHALYGDDGFRRLTRDGAWFRHCHYPYAFTFTAAGHASIGTGCAPEVHGIVDNAWYDNKARTWVYATDRTRDLALPPKERKGAGPEQLLVDGLGDALTKATDGKGRVVSLSLKDRSAILMAGRGRGHLCLWHDVRSKPGPGSNLGKFVTNADYYTVPAESRRWLADFNVRQFKDMEGLWKQKYFWSRLHENRPLVYAFGAGPDDVEDEGTGIDRKQGRTFPHPMVWEGDPKKPRAGPDATFYQTIHNSPFGNDLLLDLAKEAIDREGLGRHETPDLLCVSFSSNDVVGHCWGPDSQEVMDITLRSDRVVAQLLAHLDERVGKGNYVVCLTADHGVCPLPEVLAARGLKGGRVDPKPLLEEARAFLRTTYGGNEKEPCLLGEEQPDRFNGWFGLDPSWLKARKLDRAVVAAKLAEWLRLRPNVMAAYTHADFLTVGGKLAPEAERVRRSFHPDRCGDVALVLKPYWQLIRVSPNYRATHGTPHEYDTHVPLLIYGTGVRAGAHEEAVTPLAVAPVLARAIGVTPPVRAKDPIPEGLFAQPDTADDDVRAGRGVGQPGGRGRWGGDEDEGDRGGDHLIPHLLVIPYSAFG